MSRSPLILMMAGGTGGHVYPALAVATELLARGHRVEWVGTARGLEERVVPAAGITLHHLPVRGFRGKGVTGKLVGLIALLVASAEALWLVARCWPAVVIGMGGYVAGPAGVAAWLLRRPLLIHEQNAVAGTTNRMLAPLAKTVVAGFPAAFRSAVEFRVLGNPVRSDILDAGRDYRYDYAGQRPLRLLVLGGSLGARPINECMPQAVKRLFREGLPLEVRHQCGDAHVSAVSAAYGSVRDTVRVQPFIEDMADAYVWSDIVICRAGALTVAELAVVGRPAILIPLPHAIDDHQTANARSLADRGGAILLRQSDMTAQSVAHALKTYIDYPERLCAMAAASHAAAMPRATVDVTDCCEELLHAE